MCLNRIKQVLLQKYDIILIILIVSTFILVSVVVFFSISEEMGDIARSPEPQTLVIPFNINLKGETGFVKTDATIGLNLTYPSEVAIVNDRIELVGKAKLSKNASELIDHISLSFQNCLTHPLKFDQWGIPEQGFIHFINQPPDYAGLDFDRNTGEIFMYMKSDSNVTWLNEGTHTPIIGIFFKDGTNQTMSQDTSPIIVYPRTHLTEIKSTKVNMYLTTAVFIFSTFTVISICIEILLFKKNNDEKIQVTLSKVNSTNVEVEKAIKQLQKSLEKHQSKKSKPQ